VTLRKPEIETKSSCVLGTYNTQNNYELGFCYVVHIGLGVVYANA